MTLETTARKHGYKARDTDGNFPPPLSISTPPDQDGSSSSSASSSSSSTVWNRAIRMNYANMGNRQRSLWSVGSEASSRSRTTQGSNSPELGATPTLSDPPILLLPPTPSQGSDRQLRKRAVPAWLKNSHRLTLPRVGDKEDLAQQRRRTEEQEEGEGDTQRARKRLRSYQKFLERHPRGIAFEKAFVDKRPPGGFDEGYEDFKEIEEADVDTDLLVSWLTQMNYEVSDSPGEQQYPMSRNVQERERERDS